MPLGTIRICAYRIEYYGTFEGRSHTGSDGTTRFGSFNSNYFFPPHSPDATYASCYTLVTVRGRNTVWRAGM